MKVFDTHFHLKGTETSAQELVKSFDEAGIERVCLIAPGGRTLGTPTEPNAGEASNEEMHKGNQYLVHLVREAPDRFVGLARVNPLAPGATDELQWAYEHGLKGLKLFCIGWYPEDERVAPIYEKAASLGMPILFHTGILGDGRNSQYHRPAGFEVIKDFPDLKIIMAHVGWPWTDEAIAVAGMGPKFRGNYQIHVDITPGAPLLWRKEVINKAVNYLDEGVLVFGTDAGPGNCVSYGKQVIQSIKTIFTELEIPRSVQEDIFWNNAVALYGE